MNEREMNQMLELTRDRIGEEACDMIGSLYIGDFTMPELIALRAVIRPVWERQQEQERHPAPVLTLARREKMTP